MVQSLILLWFAVRFTDHHNSTPFIQSFTLRNDPKNLHQKEASPGVGLLAVVPCDLRGGETLGDAAHLPVHWTLVGHNLRFTLEKTHSVRAEASEKIHHARRREGTSDATY